MSAITQWSREKELSLLTVGILIPSLPVWILWLGRRRYDQLSFNSPILLSSFCNFLHSAVSRKLTAFLILREEWVSFLSSNLQKLSRARAPASFSSEKSIALSWETPQLPSTKLAPCLVSLSLSAFYLPWKSFPMPKKIPVHLLTFWILSPLPVSKKFKPAITLVSLDADYWIILVGINIQAIHNSLANIYTTLQLFPHSLTPQGKPYQYFYIDIYSIRVNFLLLFCLSQAVLHFFS